MNRAMKQSGIPWIGAIPSHWRIARLKDLRANKPYAIVDGPFGSAISANDYRDEGVPLVRIVNLTGKYVDDSTTMHISPELAQSVKRSAFGLKDIVFAKTGATVGKCSINNSIEYGILSSSCVKISIAETFNSHYFYYFFCTNQFNLALRLACGGSTRDTINLTPFSNLPCIVPPLTEQQSIAEFLNVKCGEIDEMISLQEKIIEELKAYKQAIILETVTKGLNPDAPMKESGIDWVGIIPVSWDVMAFRRLFAIKKTIAGEEGWDVLSVTQQGLKVKDLSSNEGQMADDYSNYQRVQPGDFVMNHMDLLTGWIDISKFSGVTSPDYRVFQIRDNSVSRRYFLYIFQACYKGKIFYHLGQGVSGQGRWRLPAKQMLLFKLPVPSIEEQNAIVEFLDAKTFEIDSLISLKKAKIESLKEYKQSIIYEYVTGKKIVNA